MPIGLRIPPGVAIYARISGPFQSMGTASSSADNSLAEPIPRRPDTRNLAPAKPHGTLPHRPAATRVVWIARHTVHTAPSATSTSDNLREKNYCEIKQPNAAPCPQHGERRVVAPRGSGSETGVHNTGARPLPVGGFGCRAGVRDEM